MVMRSSDLQCFNADIIGSLTRSLTGWRSSSLRPGHFLLLDVSPLLRVLKRATDSCLMLDCVRVINFLLLFLLIIIIQTCHDVVLRLGMVLVSFVTV